MNTFTEELLFPCRQLSPLHKVARFQTVPQYRSGIEEKDEDGETERRFRGKHQTVTSLNQPPRDTEASPPPIRIGGLNIDPPLVLAPMAGITDLPFRRLMARSGIGLVTSEMISAEGLCRNDRKSWRLFVKDPQITVPQAVQIFGRDAGRMAQAAGMLEQKGADLIDINAGCPVRKVARQGAGARLLRDLDLLADIVERVRAEVTVPVTVKLRLGWDSNSINIVETARRLASAGTAALTIHARTAVQLYRGRADWTWIQAARQELSIPVIGNGDVSSPASADRMLRDTGCGAVMIGRASLGNPWLIQAIANRWRGREHRHPTPGWDHFLETVCRHLDDFVEERVSPPGHYRKILVWYSKGCPGSAQLRAKLMNITEPERMLKCFQNWVEDLKHRGHPFLPAKVGPRPDSLE